MARLILGVVGSQNKLRTQKVGFERTCSDVWDTQLISWSLHGVER